MFRQPPRDPTGTTGRTTWESYASAERLALRRAGVSESDATSLLSYARSLHVAQLPIIYEPAHLSALLGYDHDFVRAAAWGSKHFYRTFSIAKRRPGGAREIAEPLPDLKRMQRWILKNAVEPIAVSAFAKAYVRGRSIKDNARFHRKQPVIIKMDLKDFFPSIRYPSVRGVFIRVGYSISVASFLAALCTLNGSLPQGAPTSAALSNLCCRRLDKRLGRWAQRLRLRYTRYSDDLTFSGPNIAVGRVTTFVTRVAEDCGFRTNHEKTRVLRAGGRQLVTGIVTNDRLAVPRPIRRRFRQQVYYIRKYGLEAHVRHIGEVRRNYLSHLIGVGTHIVHVDPDNQEVREDLRFLRGIEAE